MCILVNLIVTYGIVPKREIPVALHIFLVSCVHRHIVIVIMIMEFVWENCMRIK